MALCYLMRDLTDNTDLFGKLNTSSNYIDHQLRAPFGKLIGHVLPLCFNEWSSVIDISGCSLDH